MLEQEDCVQVGGAGWMPLLEVTPQQAMDVIGGRIPEDSQYRNACQWGLILFDSDDFIEDMPIDAKRQMLELVENSRGTRYAAARNYLLDAVKAITEEGS